MNGHNGSSMPIGGVPWETMLVLGRATVALLIVGVPLAFDVTAIWGHDPGELVLAPKAVVLASSALLGLAFLMGSFPDKNLRTVASDLRQLRSPWPVALVLIVLMTIGWLSASDTGLSVGFLGPANRNDGLLLFIGSAIGMFAGARLGFLSHRDALLAVVGLVAVATVVSVFAVAETYGIDAWRVVGVEGVDPTGGRSTLGHPSLVSLFGALGAAAAVELATRKRGRVISLTMTVVGSWLAFGVAVTGGRAAYAALFAVLLWNVVRKGLLGRRVKRTPHVFAPVVVLIVLVAGLQLAPVQGVTPEAWASVVQGADRSWNSRVATYSVAVKALAAQPLRPYGVGAFRSVAWDFASASEERQMMSETVPPAALDRATRIGRSIFFTDPATGQRHAVLTDYDKVHNYILDVALGFGIPSAMVLVAFVGLCMLKLMRASSDVSRTVASVVLVFVVAAQAWFPTIAVDPPVWTLLGVGLGAAMRTNQRRDAPAS